MANNTLEDALRAAGLDDETLRLIGENKLLAERVAKSATEICSTFRGALANIEAFHSNKTYRGRFEVARIPEIVAAIRAKGLKPTQTRVAEALSCSAPALSKLFERNETIKRLYRDAVGAFL